MLFLRFWPTQVSLRRQGNSSLYMIRETPKGSALCYQFQVRCTLQAYYQNSMKDREEKETALFDLPRMQITRLIQTDNTDLYRLEFQGANPNKV
ncbi:hypothetical protein TNCT_104281 [Trichonephila clavata]|uniref:Uncharacterized protein n=1 Tax=Trichonephila clavata TaxID=2740835 RepID=A0A8X6K6F9_TRICU|nr:hypothetical protein TNCT_104281 [Trichonephila clavata]